ncbi:MAG: sel1 repeat family protein [Gammaproteobacteria bacterium]|nr:sel1 repeat family protein [Gammaproteobacteria bacterium]
MQFKRQFYLAVSAFIVLNLAPLNAQADRYDDGMLAYTAGQYDVALDTWKAMADSGHSRAQFNLAYMYEFGIAVPANSEEAVKWYTLSAQQGYARAQNFLGWMYEMGKGVAQNRTEALKWLRKAADQGSDDALADFRLVSKRQQRTQESHYKQELLEALNAQLEAAQQRYEQLKNEHPNPVRELEASNHIS